MKRLSVIFAVVLAVALVLPNLATASDPIPLMPPESGTLHVPSGVPLTNIAAWLAIGRGLTQLGCKNNQFYVKITDDAGGVFLDVKPEDSFKYWHDDVVIADPEIYGDLTAFNSKIGATPYAREWEAPLPDGLPSGNYHVVSGVIQTHALFDLFVYFDGQRSPLRLPAGEYPFPDWDFVVD